MNDHIKLPRRERIRKVVQGLNSSYSKSRFDTSDIIQETEIQLWKTGRDELENDFTDVDQALLARSLSQLPEVTGQPGAGQHALRLRSRPRAVVRVEPVAVPLLAERPHHVQCGVCAIGRSVSLRPEEADRASSLDDVIPPVPGRDREVDESVCAVQLAALNR